MFGPDGKLYGTTGDLNRDRAEQNVLTDGEAVSADVGGIYRINAPGSEADGSLPEDNPFSTNPNADFHKWYAYGIRNTFGIAIDPVTDDLWITENGPDHYDEINRVLPGFNGGWKKIKGPVIRDTDDVDDLVDLLDASSYSDPEFSFFDPLGLVDLEFLADFSDPSYQDAVVFGGSNGRSKSRLHILRLNEARDGFAVTGDLADLVDDSDEELDALVFGRQFGTATDIQVGPDKALYVASFTKGTIFRVFPQTLLGDLDGDVDVDDIDDFVLGISDPEQYENLFGIPPTVKGDMDGDNDLDFDDIPGFVAALPAGATAQAIPEPASVLFLALGVVNLFHWRMRRP